MTKLAIDANAKGIQCLRPLSTEVISASSTASSTTAVGNNIRILRIMCDTDCFYDLETTATTATGVPLPAGTVEFIHINAGDTVSVVTTSAAGNFYATAMI